MTSSPSRVLWACVLTTCFTSATSAFGPIQIGWTRPRASMTARETFPSGSPRIAQLLSRPFSSRVPRSVQLRASGNLVALDVPARGRGFEILGEWLDLTPLASYGPGREQIERARPGASARHGIASTLRCFRLGEGRGFVTAAMLGILG